MLSFAAELPSRTTTRHEIMPSQSLSPNERQNLQREAISIFAFTTSRPSLGGPHALTAPLLNPFFVTLIDTEVFRYERLLNQQAIDLLAVNWKRHVLNTQASSDVDSLSETVDAVYDAIGKFGPGAVDLTTLPKSNIHGEHAAVVLRATFSRRDEVPGWYSAIGIAATALEKAGVDIDDALAGLR